MSLVLVPSGIDIVQSLLDAPEVDILYIRMVFLSFFPQFQAMAAANPGLMTI